jgi:hypothetical protein
MTMTTKLDVRLTAEEREKLEALAKMRRRSLGAEMRAALGEWLVLHADGFSFYEYDES